MGKYLIAAMVLLLFTQPVNADSVVTQLRKLCADSASQTVDSASLREARKIYEMMKEKEKRHCKVQSDSYIHYLIEKYRTRLYGQKEISP